jgi:CHRD domain
MKASVAAVVVGVVVAAVPAAALAGRTASATSTSQSYTIKATLDTKHEVPVPKDATAAKGLLTGKLVLAGKKSSFTWQLKVSGLSGRVVTAGVAVGAPGKRGTSVLPLCNKCLTTAHGAYIGPYVANATFVKALLHDGMYATVVTKLNPKGEIRGQIKATSA